MGQDIKVITKEAKKEVQKIADTVNIEEVNKLLGLEMEDNKGFVLTKQSLKNIGEWALNGKSQTEIRNSLELSPTEWAYLLKVCPQVMCIMERSTAYAEILIAGNLMELALGGRKVKKRMPMKKKIYEDGKVVGEEFEIVEWEEELPPSEKATIYIAEHKLDENFSDKPKSSSKEYREIVESLSEEERQAIKDANDNG